MRVGVVIQGLPFNKLHYEIGQAVVVCPTVKQTGNVRMIECRQDLAFGAKTPQNEVSVHAALNELDRHPHLEFAVHANGFINRAHAPSSYLTLDLISPEATSNHGIAVFGMNQSLEGTECI